jgi:hypothetical protein
MKATVLALSLLLTACSLTPRQRMAVIGGVLLTGAIAAQKDRNTTDHVGVPSNPCATPEMCR